MPKEIINNKENDQLKEIVNIGAGNASTALSTMLGKKIQMNVPEATVGPIEKVQQFLGSKDDTVLAVFLKMYGDANGAMVMIFSPKSALAFAKLLTKKDKADIDEFDEEDLSAMREIGNILLGASITALSKFLDMNILHTIPDAVVDMLGAIMDSVIVEIGQEEEKALSFKVTLSIEEEGVDGDLYFLFDSNSTARILSAARAKLGNNNG